MPDCVLIQHIREAVHVTDDTIVEVEPAPRKDIIFARIIEHVAGLRRGERRPRAGLWSDEHEEEPSTRYYIAVEGYNIIVLDTIDSVLRYIQTDLPMLEVNVENTLL